MHSVDIRHRLFQARVDITCVIALFFCLIAITFFLPTYMTIFCPTCDMTVQRKGKIHLRSPGKSMAGLRRREPLISPTTVKHFILLDTLPHFQNGIIQAGKRIFSLE